MDAERRAEDELGRRARGLAILMEASQSLVATLNVDAVLQATTDSVAKLFGLDTAAVYLLEGEQLRLGATTPPLPPAFPEELRRARPEDHPHLREAIESGAPVLVPDMPQADLSAAERAITDLRGLRTVLFLPLRAEEKSVGALIVGSVAVPRSIREVEITLCRTLANLAALAVENARLYTSLQRHAAELERQGRERLELEQRLLHAQKLESLGILAGGIAHDFNNLLLAILGNLDLALDVLPPATPARANIEQSVQAALRAADLTRQMLAYSGKGRFVVKSTDLNALVEENARLFRSGVARTTALGLRPDRPLPAILADAGQVQQVIMNLITNASEAIGGTGGLITIATGVQDCDAQCLKRSLVDDVPTAGRFVFLEVSDTGCGMDDETRKRLFDPFFSTKATGRGLGMSAILGIVRGHQGAIFVDSTVGRGTTIRVLFPATAALPSAPQASVGAGAGQAVAPGPVGTVLVVDDEEFVRATCKAMVESFGLQVLTAADGREAVDVFRAHADTIDLVILDLTMPNMDGRAAFEELVRIRPDVRVILSSGYNEQAIAQRISAGGLAGFIQKPYSLKTLQAALARGGVLRA